MFFPAGISVSDPHSHVIVAQTRQGILRPRAQRFYDLYGVNMANQVGQDSRLVSRTRANLQNGHVLIHPHQVGHQRNDIGLRNCLARTDWQGVVQVGEMTQGGGHEFVAQYCGHGLHHFFVQRGNAGITPCFDHRCIDICNHLPTRRFISLLRRQAGAERYINQKTANCRCMETGTRRQAVIQLLLLC